MNADIFKEIKQAIESSPRNQMTAEMHLQMIKYANDFKMMSSLEFCEAVGLNKSYATEFSKMRNIANRLISAGLDVSKI